MIHRRWNLRAAMSVAVLLGSMHMSTSSAVGDNWAGASGVYGLCSNGINRTDSAAMSFNYSDLSATSQAASNWVRSVKIEPTDMSTSTHATASTETDLIVLDQYYTDYCNIDWNRNVWGLYNCRSLRPDNSCEQANVRFNNTYTENWTDGQRRSNTCHEFGHAIGLMHRNAPGCMIQGDLSSASYNTHDLAHINNAF